MDEFAKITRDIAAVQQMLLPRKMPDITGYCFAAHYQPCEAAGGDFYGFGNLNDGVIGIGIADVSGHGLRAAIVMTMLRSYLAAIKIFRRPMETLSADLNAFFAEVPDLHALVTMVFMYLEIESGNFVIRNCGHPYPKIRRRDGKVETIKEGHNLPLGILFTGETAQASGHLNRGDAMVLYTDGITDSVATDGSFFDTDRLDAAIGRAAFDADSIVRSIVNAVVDHRGQRARRDDECILVVMRN